jgi:hypothetical protein
LVKIRGNKYAFDIKVSSIWSLFKAIKKYENHEFLFFKSIVDGYLLIFDNFLTLIHVMDGIKCGIRLKQEGLCIELHLVLV